MALNVAYDSRIHYELKYRDQNKNYLKRAAEAQKYDKCDALIVFVFNCRY